MNLSIILTACLGQPTVRLYACITAWASTPRTETVFVRLCTFVPHFLAPLVLAEQRLPKAMLTLIVPVLVQQDLLLECKPLVDLLKVAIFQENVGILAKEQLYAARAWELGASASTMSVAKLQAAAGHFKIALVPTTLLLYFGPEGPQYWYGHTTGSSLPKGTCILGLCHKGVKHQVGSTQRTDERTASSYLSHARDSGVRYSPGAQTRDLLCHDPITRIWKPLDNIEFAKYHPIWLLAELEEATYGLRGTSLSVTSPGRPSLPTSTTSTL